MNLKGTAQHPTLYGSLHEEVEHFQIFETHLSQKKNCYGKFHSFLLDQRHSDNFSAEAHGGHLVMRSVKLACEQALLFGRTKRAARERASERRSR